MRICAVGDSFVNGTGDPECLGWIGRLVSAQKRAGRDVTLYNLGVRGDTSADILDRWEREVAARRHADAETRLIFSFGVNDCCPKEGSAAPRLTTGESLANAAAILDQAHAIAPTLMVGPPPIADAAVNARVAELDAALGPACEVLGVDYLPVFAMLKSSDVWMQEVAAGDGAHPGAAGYNAFAALAGDWPAWRNWFAPMGDAH